MKINTNTRKHSSSIIPRLIIALLAISILAVAGLYFLKLGPFKQKTSSQPTPPTPTQIAEQKKVETQDKKDLIDQTKNQTLPGETVPTPTSPDTIHIETSQQPGIVTVATKLTGYSAGSCALTITNGTKVVTKTADIIYQPEFSTCAGFSITISDVGIGKWSLSLTVTPSGGAPITKTTEINV